MSTNSVTQGEQVAQLWPILFDRYGLEIAFAHRTFYWGSDAKGKAHVHVIIVGLVCRADEPREKRLFSYPSIEGEPIESRHQRLTAYLFDASTVKNSHLFVRELTKPLVARTPMRMGSKLVEGGHLLFDDHERSLFLKEEPRADPYLVPVIGSQEFIRGEARWILKLKDVAPDIIRSMPAVAARVAAVREYRLGSKKIATRRLADFPTMFEVHTAPEKPYLVIPQVSSERRQYIPIGWVKPPTLPTNLVLIVEDASLYDFGLLASGVHMAWLRHIGGRLKSDYRYSIGLVYNTFPSPDPTPAQRDKVEHIAQAVLDARAAWPTSSLADLYDPDTMPANLRKAHADLDRAVDRLYRREPFASDRDRVEHLFGRYEALVNPLEREAARHNKRVARRRAKEDGG